MSMAHDSPDLGAAIEHTNDMYITFPPIYIRGVQRAQRSTAGTTLHYMLQSLSDSRCLLNLQPPDLHYKN